MMTIPEIKQRAASVAAELKALPKGSIPRDVRRRFIEVRSALYQRGIYDPVLVRLDSITAPPADPAEIAEELTVLADGLTV